MRPVLSLLGFCALACGVGHAPATYDTAVDPYAAADADAEEYAEVATELASYRSRFLDDEADELYAEGHWLFWLTFPGYDPVLHAWDSRADQQVDYDFSIGSDTYNYRASSALVVTATPEGSSVVYSAYAIDKASAREGTAEFDAPTNGSRWHAYAVDGTTVYLVVSGGRETALYTWEPPGEPERQWSFEELGYELGEFWDFDVEGTTMIFIESGRIWRADVRTGEGEWLGNETQVSGSVSYDSEAVIWATDQGIYWYDYDANGRVVNLSDRINTADYRLNDTYDSTHKLVETGFWRDGNAFVYEAYSGIYLYDLGTSAFEPIILEMPDSAVRVTWRDPVMLDDGTLFVTGLESESGSVGADGPVWRVDHPALSR